MAEIKIFGYTDKLSVKQGEKIDFMCQLMEQKLLMHNL